MELRVCPHCSAKVLPSPGGICPSCRRPIALGEESTENQEPLPVKPAEMKVATRGGPIASRANPTYVPGVLLVVVSLVGIGNSVFQMLAPERPAAQTPADPNIRAAVENGAAVARMAASPIVLVMNLVMLAGSVAMIKQEHWGLALTAAILANLPCSIVFCLSLPVGVWALVALNRAGVRASFR